jgi:CBS domain-containing protein
MRVTRIDYFKTEIRRFRDGLQSGPSEPSGSKPVGHRPVVAPLLAIRDVMETGLATVSPDTTIRAALALMTSHRISSVPVVDEHDRIVGALNESDLMRVFYEPDVQCVGDVMTRNPVRVPIDAPLVDVVDHLMSTNFRRVLIHDDERLVGVITRSHLMPALLDVLEQRAAPGASSDPH